MSNFNKASCFYATMAALLSYSVSTELQNESSFSLRVLRPRLGVAELGRLVEYQQWKQEYGQKDQSLVA